MAGKLKTAVDRLQQACKDNGVPYEIAREYAQKVRAVGLFPASACVDAVTDEVLRGKTPNDEWLGWYRDMIASSKQVVRENELD